MFDDDDDDNQQQQEQQQPDGLVELLRRLPVVVVEDGLLHPGFPVLVWTMLAASKGFRVPQGASRRVYSTLLY
jgi:hypothetical protein